MARLARVIGALGNMAKEGPLEKFVFVDITDNALDLVLHSGGIVRERVFVHHDALEPQGRARVRRLDDRAVTHDDHRAVALIIGPASLGVGPPFGKPPLVFIFQELCKWTIS